MSDRGMFFMYVDCSGHLPSSLFCAHNADKTASGDGCTTFLIGSNVFQCKTEVEWAGIAKKQCQIRLVAVAETVFASVRYPCRFGRQSNSVTVFQQVAVSCCKLSSGTPTPAGKCYRCILQYQQCYQIVSLACMVPLLYYLDPVLAR